MGAAGSAGLRDGTNVWLAARARPTAPGPAADLCPGTEYSSDDYMCQWGGLAHARATAPGPAADPCRTSAPARSDSPANTKNSQIHKSTRPPRLQHVHVDAVEELRDRERR